MFTVIIPYYKKRKYIERCLNSVLKQTYQNFEIILIDDGSEDDIKNLISDKYSDRVKLLEQKNQGVSVARNRGIEVAKNPYIHFLDADDAIHPQFFEIANQIIEENNEIKIIGANYSSNKIVLLNKYAKIEYTEVKDYFKIAIKNTLFATSASIVNSEFFKNNSGFNSKLKRGQDHEVWFRVLASKGKAFYIENTMMFYSKEDPNQATMQLGQVDKSLVGLINDLYQPILAKEKNTDLSKFVSKYVYFNLYPYYFSDENNVKAIQSLKSVPNHYFFLHLPYLLPLSIGKRIMSSIVLSNILRLYFKFFLRKVYL